MCIYHCLMVAVSQLAVGYHCAYLLGSDPMLMIHRQSLMAALNFVAFSYFITIMPFRTIKINSCLSRERGKKFKLINKGRETDRERFRDRDREKVNGTKPFKFFKEKIGKWKSIFIFLLHHRDHHVVHNVL